MTRIKICGVSSADIAAECLRLRVDFIGLVFVARSPRRVNPEQAASLAASAGDVDRVGLFVDPRDEDVAAAVSSLTALQLHGDETPERCADLRTRFGLPVWKALGISSRADVAHSADWAGAVDLVLYDAKPAAGDIEGGRGVRFDWGLLGHRPPVPRWGLAGGLTPHNVGEAIRATNAPLVDVSSGVEDEPGIKNKEKIAAFVQAARAA